MANQRQITDSGPLGFSSQKSGLALEREISDLMTRMVLRMSWLHPWWINHRWVREQLQSIIEGRYDPHD